MAAYTESEIYQPYFAWVWDLVRRPRAWDCANSNSCAFAWTARYDNWCFFLCVALGSAIEICLSPALATQTQCGARVKHRQTFKLGGNMHNSELLMSTDLCIPYEMRHGHRFLRQSSWSIGVWLPLVGLV